MSSASSTLPSTSIRVGSMRLAIRGRASILYSSDLPRSPLSRFFRKYRYCTQIGSSRPNWARIF
ncbi:hypothetical protein D3C85_1585330 [compost metagenome]